MKKLILTLILIILAVSTGSPSGLNKMFTIISQVESNNNPDVIGDNGKAFGIVQIHKICVDDVNRIYGTNYIHEQMFEKSCADEIFSLYLQHGILLYKKKYNKEPSEKDVVRMWNGGIYNGYKKESTLKYYKKYLKILDNE